MRHIVVNLNKSEIDKAKPLLRSMIPSMSRETYGQRLAQYREEILQDILVHCQSASVGVGDPDDDNDRVVHMNDLKQAIEAWRK